MSQLKTNSIVDASGGNTATINGVAPNVNNIRGKNKIINGAMQVAQRGTSFSPISDGTYTLDRFVCTVSTDAFDVTQETTSPPDDFTHYMRVTSTGAVTPTAAQFYGMMHRLEGYSVSEFNFGKASAKTITLSFWVRSSLTGTFGGTYQNQAQNRSYPFSYTIDSANTWEQKTVTITGDTAGTWVTDNNAAVRLIWSLGMGSNYEGTAGSWSGSALYTVTGETELVGTNGATWDITGVQLEAGDTASGFEHLSYGETLAMCQRYYHRNTAVSAFSTFGICYSDTGTTATAKYYYPAAMRSAPTMSNSLSSRCQYGGGNSATVSNINFQEQDEVRGTLRITVDSSVLPTGGCVHLQSNNDQGGFLAFDAEL